MTLELVSLQSEQPYVASLAARILTECAHSTLGAQQIESSAPFGKVRESCIKQIVIDRSSKSLDREKKKYMKRHRCIKQCNIQALQD